jgi:hypothetical protein
MHEPADFVHAELWGGREQGALCESVGYHDDALSHGLFFLGLAGMDAVLLLAQAGASSLGTQLASRDLALVLANASVVAIAIVANRASSRSASTCSSSPRWPRSPCSCSAVAGGAR